MKHIHTFESFVNEGTAELIKIEGKKGVNYNKEKGTILKAAYAKDYKSLVKYDRSGWMNSAAFDEFDINPTDILVAFKDETGDVNVYTFGDGGVELA